MFLRSSCCPPVYVLFPASLAATRSEAATVAAPVYGMPACMHASYPLAELLHFPGCYWCTAVLSTSFCLQSVFCCCLATCPSCCCLLSLLPPLLRLLSSYWRHRTVANYQRNASEQEVIKLPAPFCDPL